ncbi:hypothetical protein KR009_011941 [Drosophila setifemur]|nr:hypothetical protein KR009_011941 [Drosophila setifemur]
MKVLVVLVLVLASASAGFLPQVAPVHPKDMVRNASSIEGRITNGQDAYEGQFPYQVGIYLYGLFGSRFCGGSLISSEWVMTAAHCLIGANSAVIVMGSITLSGSANNVTVNSSQFILHPLFSQLLLLNDIALINIPPVDFTDLIKKIDLPMMFSYVPEGTIARVSGWGVTSDSSNTLSSKLQYADLKTISVQECQQILNTGIIFLRKMCTLTSNGISPCRGDSGGPLTIGNTQVGIVSFGSAAGCEKGKPSVYEHVAAHRRWITQNIGF